MQVPLSSSLNPRLPMLFRVIASVEWLVLGVTGFGLFLLPTVASAQWPWQVKPFNTFFVDAYRHRHDRARRRQTSRAAARSEEVGRWFCLKVVR